MNLKASFSILFFIFCLNQSFSKEPARLPSAIETTKITQQRILLYFSGSDWCRPCIRLSKEVLSKKEFKDYASKKLLVLQVDFPRVNTLDKEQQEENTQLAEKYNPDGIFPLLVLLDENQDVFIALKYFSSDYREYIQSLNPFLARE